MKNKYVFKATYYAEGKIKEMIKRGEFIPNFMERIDWAYYKSIKDKLKK